MENNIARMEEIAGRLYELGGIFADNHSKSLAKNKSAAVRARKATMEMERLCKEYRKLSLEESRK